MKEKSFHGRGFISFLTLASFVLMTLTGIGRKTLPEVCQQVGIDIQKAQDRLAKHKIDMKPEQTMRDVATPLKVEPVDILKLILIEDYKLK